MRQKILVILIGLFCAISAYSEIVNVNNVSYDIDADKKTAKVIAKKGGYSGSVNISSFIIHNGISYSVTSIGRSAFEGCTKLNSITIPNSVIRIEYAAFYYCSSLTSVSIPNSVTSIEEYAFLNCSSLTSVTIPNSVTSIKDAAFEGCVKLNSITIPNSVTSIGAAAFEGCAKLNSVTISNGVTRIGWKAFYGCESLTSITIPQSVTAIGDDAFSGCKKLSVRTASYVSLAKSGIPADRITRISQKEALADYTHYNQNQTVAHQKITEPANLIYVEGSMQFTDDTGNKAIDANETCHIRFKIRNDGKGEARGCKAKVTLAGSMNGLTIQSIAIPTIAPQNSVELDIPVSANMQTMDGNVTFTIEITEPNGFGTDPMELTVATKAFVSPYLRIVDYSVTSSSGSTKLEKKRPFNLQLMLQNTQYGLAENIEVELKFPEGVFLVNGEGKTMFASMEGGKAQSIDYEMVVNNNYASDKIPVQVILKEKYGEYAENRTINLEINQMLSSSKLNIEAVEQNNRPEIQLATIGSDVDRNIPKSNVQNKNTFVLIIANENYHSVAPVPFAQNDGRIFHHYCEQTLGIPSRNIHEQANATGNQIKAQINWLRNVVEVFDAPNIIFYYAGHGIPDEDSKSAYILPVDGIITDISTGYKLDDLYSALGDMPAAHITVFMDACFSGSKREDGMLASARGVALKAKTGVPQGNMVVFSAAQGDETAYPNREQQHGMFTYYLLKKLQETEGNVDLKTLGDYVTKQVTQQSLLLNDKKQTPCVTPSAAVGTEWQSWKLK